MKPDCPNCHEGNCTHLGIEQEYNRIIKLLKTTKAEMECACGEICQSWDAGFTAAIELIEETE